MPHTVHTSDLSIVIENPKGSYKSFEIDNDPVWEKYPLKGVTYPVDYGYIEGYQSEDKHDLDVFVGSGTLYGYMKVWRCDVPIETKVLLEVSQEELDAILKEFAPVIKEQGTFTTLEEFKIFLNNYTS